MRVEIKRRRERGRGRGGRGGGRKKEEEALVDDEANHEAWWGEFDGKQCWCDEQIDA